MAMQYILPQTLQQEQRQEQQKKQHHQHQRSNNRRNNDRSSRSNNDSNNRSNINITCVHIIYPAGISCGSQVNRMPKHCTSAAACRLLRVVSNKLYNLESYCL